jgi:hypothetical protein
VGCDVICVCLQSGKEFLPNTIVIDFDHWMNLCMSTWSTQAASDAAGIRKLYAYYDVDNNGVLSFEEFCTLIRACAPTMTDVLTEKRLSKMFQEVRSCFSNGSHVHATCHKWCFPLQAFDLESSGGPSAAAIAAAASGEDADDTLSPDAFAVLCDRYGIVPYRKANSIDSMPSLPSPDGLPSPLQSPESRVDEDEFITVRRVSTKMTRARRQSVVSMEIGSETPAPPLRAIVD